jgi:tetratricopeptide (TPR) repeat protein
MAFMKFYPSRERNLTFSTVLKNWGAPVNGDPLPTAFVVGMAYSPIRPLIVSVDGTFPMNLSNGALSESPSVASGVDVALTTFWALQGGFDFKIGRPRATMGSTVEFDKINLNISYVVDLMTTLAVPDRLAIEVKVNLGDLGRQEAEDRARELYLAGLDAYAKGNLEEAIIQWDKALEILPTFLPARELRETAQRTLDLRQKMESSQKIE